ncbi:MAG: hypothetical protein HY246_18060 [Proteobacteria bacterium]|nr:hypothetical protein [Pseudomonadota bacterium]
MPKSDQPNKSDHDRAVRFIAASRFPFPGQKDWPADNLTITNETVPQRGIRTPDGTHYPDIVIVTGAGELREVAEIETEIGELQAKTWAWGSAAADDKTKTGVRHFFVYVPDGLEAKAREVLERNAISYAGVHSWSVDAGGKIRIVPVFTTGDPKDHVESVSA